MYTVNFLPAQFASVLRAPIRRIWAFIVCPENIIHMLFGNEHLRVFLYIFLCPKLYVLGVLFLCHAVFWYPLYINTLFKQWCRRTQLFQCCGVFELCCIDCTGAISALWKSCAYTLTTEMQVFVYLTLYMSETSRTWVLIYIKLSCI